MAFNPRYKINLVTIFNRAFSSEDLNTKRQLRATIDTPFFRNTYAKMAIDEIIDRTENKHVDRHGNAFVKYSKSYVGSDIFKIYAKDPSEVNLHLTGEMLASMNPKQLKESISIEMIGTLNKAKAHGHINGIRRKDGTKAVRDFLGLPEEVENEIMRKSMRIARNPEVEAVAGFLEGTTINDAFGNVGGQRSFASSLFTTDVLALLARFNLDGNSNN